MVILDENYNVCDIYNIVNKVKGLRTGSSPTDAWIVTFKDNVFDRKKNKLTKAFLKIYSNLSYFDNADYELDESMSYLKKAIEGLTYETMVYRDIITPLVDLNICPNFIRYIASGNACHYNDLLRAYKSSYKKSADKIKMRLNKIINNNLLNYETSNIIISDETRKYKPNKGDIKDFDKFEFDIILTETFDNTMSFHDLLQSDYVQEINIFNILFQIFAACYSMSLSKMVHNDLHTGNIMIRTLKKPKIITYIIKKVKYVLKIKYLVHIYDFDRAYVKRLGDNHSLDMYDVFSQNNEFYDNKDILKLLCSVYKYTGNKFYLKCLTSNEKHLKDLIKLFEKDERCNFQVKKYKPVLPSFFKNYNDSLTIIKIFAENLPQIKIKEKVNKEDIYICDKEFFRKNGDINMQKLNEIRKSVLSGSIKSKSKLKTKSPKRKSRKN